MKYIKATICLFSLILFLAGIGLFCFDKLMKYEDADNILADNSNQAGAVFFTEKYYEGVIERARVAGCLLMLASAIIGVWVCMYNKENIQRCGSCMSKQLFAKNGKINYDIIAILTLAFIIRCAYLFQPISSDEARGYYAWTARPFVLAISDYRAPQHLLYTLLNYPLVRVFGNAEWVIRLPALIGGVGMIFLIYQLGKKAINEGGGLLGAILVLGNPLLVHYSVNGRAYTLHICFVLLFWIAALNISGSESTVRNYIMLVISGVAGLVALPTMIYVLVGSYPWIALHILSQGGKQLQNMFIKPLARLKGLFLSGALTVLFGGLAYLPAYIASDKWYSIDADDVSSVLEWQELVPSAWRFIVTAFWQWNIGMPRVVCYVAVVLFAYGAIRIRKTKIFSLCIFNMVGVLGVLAVLRIVPYARTIMYLACPFYMIVATGLWFALSRFWAIDRRKIKIWVIGGILVAGLLLNLFHVYRNAITGVWFALAPGTREIFQYLGENAKERDHVICLRPSAGPAYYYSLRYNVKSTLWFPLEKKPPLEIFGESNRVYMVVNKYSGQELSQILRASGWKSANGEFSALKLFENQYGILYQISCDLSSGGRNE